jgi:hypothetical protein
MNDTQTAMTDDERACHLRNSQFKLVKAGFMEVWINRPETFFHVRLSTGQSITDLELVKVSDDGLWLEFRAIESSRLVDPVQDQVGKPRVSPGRRFSIQLSQVVSVHW